MHMYQIVTWIRERMTWYGYVADSAPSLDAPDMKVYVMFDYANQKKRRVSYN
jgi:hypothetical protein